MNIKSASLAITSLVVCYVAGSIAIDTASLWMYALAFLSFGYAIRTVVISIKRHDTKPAKARRASTKTTR